VLERSGIPELLTIRVLDEDAQEVASYHTGSTLTAFEPGADKSPELDRDLAQLWKMIERQDEHVVDFLEAVRRDIADI
jgi:hypothetical protein